jgi:hypothetical protein
VLFSFAFNGINRASALFMIQKFAPETWQFSLMMISGISIVLANSFLARRWVPRLGERKSGTFELIDLVFFSVLVFRAPCLWLAFFLNMLVSANSASFSQRDLLACKNCLRRNVRRNLP